ncbi:MAG: bifunctional acetate--CoA ligase family protein/GNAT family N-acetyltransferase [Flammeovirgaceae bacterium]|nr:bifunctional acetate--CoA ligase family protein/GNAT family N-acetyltransferase [Flammeovirgaceae bacterium]
MLTFFHPKSIAIIGASEKKFSVGRKLYENLKSSDYDAKLYIVNVNNSKIFGEKSYSNVKKIKAQIDLAIIAIPPKEVPGVIRECGEKGILNAIVITEGFKVSGNIEEGLLEEELMIYARKYNMRVLGPNCVGFLNPHSGLNASILRARAQPGQIAFISQSGALCNAILDWGNKEKFGFSQFVSIGSMADLEWGDLILFLGNDPHTKAILIFMESIVDVRKFISAAREVAYTKPIIVIKTGKSFDAAQISVFHTGVLANHDSYYDASFRRSGVLRVDTLGELFYMASVLARQPITPGKRLGIISNAGGPAVLATDALINGGGKLAKLSPQSISALGKIKASEKWRLANPLDIHRDASPISFEKVVEIFFNENNVDGLLIIITPQLQIDLNQIAIRLRKFAQIRKKPIIVSIMGGDEANEVREILSQANIPVFPFPDIATRVFNYMWKNAFNIKGIYETPRLPKSSESQSILKIQAIKDIETAFDSGRTWMTEYESKEILKKYDIPVIPTTLATNEMQAVAIAKKIGFPVTIKVHSEMVMDKRINGGVVLNINSKKSLKKAFYQIKTHFTNYFGPQSFKGVTIQKMFLTHFGLETILSSEYDEQFGSLIYFGNSGKVVGLYEDGAIGFPPLNTTLAHRMLEQIKIYQLLKNQPAFNPKIVDELEQIMVKFSHIVAENKIIKSFKIHPLAITYNEISVLDARIEFHEPGTNPDDLTPLAIRPYPSHYSKKWTMRNGTDINIRPIRPEDEPLFINFHKTLSNESVYLRYFHQASFDYRVSHERLSRICFVDYDREIALVAVTEEQNHDDEKILGVGRIVKSRVLNEAEFSVTISDNMHGMGLGTELIRRIVEISKLEKIDKLLADILIGNQAMVAIVKKFGFETKLDLEEKVIKVWRNL